MIRDFNAWFDAGFSAIIPIVPPGAAISERSKLDPGSRGKVPGQEYQGAWASFPWQDHRTTAADCRRWGASGAGIGLRAAHFPGLDIDVLDARLAQVIQDEAERFFGKTATRVGRAPKRLLIYRTAEPFGRMRLWFKDPAGATHLVELLGDGQQYVVQGTHPGTMKPYEWDVVPHELGPEFVPEITRDRAMAFFGLLRELLDLMGCEEIEAEGKGGLALDRTRIDQTAHLGDLERVAAAVALIPNDNAVAPGRDDYLRIGYAIKSAGAEDEQRALEIWTEWAMRWEGNDRFPDGNTEDVVRADWERMGGPYEVGARLLYEIAGRYGFNAAAEFFAAETRPEGEPEPGEERELTPDPDDRPVMYSDSALAIRFAYLNRDAIRWVDRWGRWMVWSGSRWEEDSLLQVKELSRQLCCSASAEAVRSIENGQKAERIASKVASRTVVESVMKLAAAVPSVAASAEQWDNDPWLLNTSEGVIDLRSGLLEPPRPGAYLTKSTSARLGGLESPCPAWMAFMHQATGGDTELVSYLQRVAGYSLTGSIREHALFFAYGPGGNGKGTFLNTLADIWADYAITSAMDTFTESRGERHSTEFARMRGARLVTAQETQQNKKWNAQALKTLAGGDLISARFMRQDFFTFMPQLKLFLSGNHKPSFGTVDDAIRRRINLIPFQHKPAVVDMLLPERLRAEHAGILAWALEGCLAWQRVGLQPPAVVREATAEYLQQEDAMGRWLAENTDTGPHTVQLMDLYADWRMWCVDAGEVPGKDKAFAQELEGRGYKRKLDSRTRRSVVQRLRLRPAPVEDVGEFAGEVPGNVVPLRR